MWADDMLGKMSRLHNLFILLLLRAANAEDKGEIRAATLGPMTSPLLQGQADNIAYVHMLDMETKHTNAA